MNNRRGELRPAPRTQAARSEATRAALIAAGRPLFAQRGYAGVGTEEIVRAAGLTRGALYHQFGGKRELFEAIYAHIEHELAERIGADIAAASGPLEAMQIGMENFLDACLDQEVQRILLGALA
jgi:AcrR family transcriptional regulator